ncbi:hypothetical protein FAIPA1_90041 [Frankia sp. AiPs1]
MGGKSDTNAPIRTCLDLDPEDAIAEGDFGLRGSLLGPDGRPTGWRGWRGWRGGGDRSQGREGGRRGQAGRVRRAERNTERGGGEGLGT